MKRTMMAILAAAALAAPAQAQLQGREIDLNQKQGWIGHEQAEYFLIEDRMPKGWGGWDGAPKGFPKPPESGGFKPEDEVTTLLDDPSERAQPKGEEEPKENPGGEDYE